jgi:hypothetical protein
MSLTLEVVVSQLLSHRQVCLFTQEREDSVQLEVSTRVATWLAWLGCGCADVSVKLQSIAGTTTMGWIQLLDITAFGAVVFLKRV